MDNKLYEKKTEIFRALANPLRLQIVDLLIDGEKCVCEIVEKLQYDQPHISKSLAKLKSAGLVIDRKDGLNVYYGITICCMGEFLSCLNKIIKNLH